MDKQVELDLLKIQVVAKAEEMKDGKSQDYKDGFDDACRIMGQATTEMLEIRSKEVEG